MATATPIPTIPTDSPLVALPVKECAKNPLNPRGVIDAAGITELAGSITTRGVLQPILVRPNKRSKGKWELVVGHRRVLAAKEAGLATIPGRVAELSDDECLEIMLIENGQRTDLDPFEEAETYVTLQRKYGHSYAEIASRCGKSKSAVFQRAALGTIKPAVREQMQESGLEVSVSELVARCVHPSQQKDAAEAVGRSRWELAMSFRDAKTYIEEEYMLRLAAVPWKLDDETLDLKAGPCTTCPKRTGNQADLFADAKLRDVCLDRECFRRKTTAARKVRLDTAKATGSEIVDDPEAVKKILNRQGEIRVSTGYVLLDGPAPGAKPGKKAKSIRAAIGKRDLPPVTVLAIPDSDALVEVVREADAKPLLAAKGYKAAKKAAPIGLSDQGKAARRARFDSAVHHSQVAAIVESLERKGSLTTALPLPLLRLVALETLDSVWSDALKMSVARRDLPKDPSGYHERLPKSLKWICENGSAQEIVALLVETLLHKHIRGWSAGDATVAEVSKILRVDNKAIARRSQKYVRTIEKRAEARKKAKAKKKAPTRKKKARRAR